MFSKKDFKNAKNKNKAAHPCLSYNVENKVVACLKNMRWNHDEFEVEYPSLNNLHKVGKYYLTILLNEKPVVPYLIEVITSPITFWNELNTRFF